MIRKNFLWVLSLMLLVAACGAPKSDDAKTSEAKEVSETADDMAFRVDTSASKIEWIGTKVSGYHSGTIKLASGEVHVSDGNVTGGKFTMNMATLVVSGPEGSDPKKNAKLEGHLKSADFFEVDKYPDVTFEITSVKPFTGTITEADDPRQADISEYKVTNPTHTVSGNLTIRDVTKNVEFPARITVAENSAEAMAKFNIDRKQWNITYPGSPDDLIRDEIHLGIHLIANRVDGGA